MPESERVLVGLGVEAEVKTVAVVQDEQTSEVGMTASSESIGIERRHILQHVDVVSTQHSLLAD